MITILANIVPRVAVACFGA